MLATQMHRHKAAISDSCTQLLLRALNVVSLVLGGVQSPSPSHDVFVVACADFLM
jgi:hypothetical protein